MFGQTWETTGFFFFVALVLALWSVFHTAQSNASPLAKALWIIAVLFLPYLGFFAWLIFGPRSAKK